MAGRIRTIKPELLEDEKVSGLSDAAWRLFVSSFLLADDHGRFRAGDKYLAASAWQDTTLTERAKAAREELEALGRIRVYAVGGELYAEIPTWKRHQRVDNAGKPRVPEPTDEALQEYATLRARSPRVAETRRELPLARAALPPTSDLRSRPPTTTTDPAPADQPVPQEPQEPQAPLKLEANDPKLKTSAIDRVWAHYVERLDKVLPLKRPVLNDRRRQQIRDRLKAYGEGRAVAAIDAFLAPSSWYVTERNGKWSGPEYLFRSAEQFEKAESAGTKHSSGNADIELGWRLWRERYRYVKGSGYADGPACAEAMKELVASMRRHANDRAMAAGGDEQQLFEAALDWVMRAFLGHAGNADFLEKSGHHLRLIIRDLPEYGLPWMPGKRQPVRVPSNVRMSGLPGRAIDSMPAEVMAAVQKAAGALSAGRGEAPSDPRDQACGKPIAPLLRGIGGIP